MASYFSLRTLFMFYRFIEGSRAARDPPAYHAVELSRLQGQDPPR